MVMEVVLRRIMGGRWLTRPSNMPSPVVAQLGTTYQILSLRELSFNRSWTSCGVMAVLEVSLRLSVWRYGA